jgi:hypothetical protein
MSLIAQLRHAEGRLDLGGEGRVLFAFHCNHDPGMCETWAPRSGANATFVLEGVELNDARTAPPDDGGPEDVEVRVVDWRTLDDGIPPESAGSFFSDDAWSALPEEIRARATVETRIGGVPSWIQSAGDAPREPWTFALQIHSSHRLRSLPSSAEDAGCTIVRRAPDGRTVREEPRVRRSGAPAAITLDAEGAHCEGSNFGDRGVAYVFLRRRGALPPEAQLFWQCG